MYLIKFLPALLLALLLAACSSKPINNKQIIPPSVDEQITLELLNFPDDTNGKIIFTAYGPIKNTEEMVDLQLSLAKRGLYLTINKIIKKTTVPGLPISYRSNSALGNMVFSLPKDASTTNLLTQYEYFKTGYYKTLNNKISRLRNSAQKQLLINYNEAVKVKPDVTIKTYLAPVLIKIPDLSDS